MPSLPGYYWDEVPLHDSVVGFLVDFLGSPAIESGVAAVVAVVLVGMMLRIVFRAFGGHRGGLGTLSGVGVEASVSVDQAFYPDVSDSLPLLADGDSYHEPADYD